MENRESLITEQQRASVSQELVEQKDIVVPSEVNEPKSQRQRLLSLDAYRGFTILGMAMADHLEDMNGAAWWLVHPKWNGFTCADLVFPAFLFIMGVAIPLAVSKNRPIRFKNITRIIMLFLIGLILNFMDDFNFSTLRILGILQRMSICYGFILFIHWITQYGKNKIKRMAAGVFMIGLVFLYIALMISWEDPSIGCYKPNNLDPYCNFAGYVDRAVFTEAHIMEKTDPEGIISTINAAMTTYVGYCFGLMILAFKGKQEKLIKYWLIFGLICLIPIYPCSLLMPFNKRLYTITFLFGVLATSTTVLTLFLLLIDYLPKLNQTSSKVIVKAIQPLTWLGMNPLAIFITLQLVFQILTNWITIGDKTPYQLFYDACFSWMAPGIGTAVYGVFYCLFYILVAGILFKKKLFLRL